MTMRVFNYYIILSLSIIIWIHETEGQGLCQRGSTRVPHPTECALFYKCDHGRALLFRCPPGTAYSPRHGVCDWDLRPCYKKKNCWADGSTVRPNPKDCTTYFKCVSGTPVLAKCSQGTEFNPKTEKCEYPRNGGRPDGGRMDCSSDTTKGLPKMYQNPSDCATFYTCNQGKPVLTYCPRGYYFNPKRGGCDDTTQAGCRATKVAPGAYQVVEKVQPERRLV